MDRQLWIASPTADCLSWEPWQPAGSYPVHEVHQVARAMRRAFPGHLCAVTAPDRQPLEPRP